MYLKYDAGQGVPELKRFKQLVGLYGRQEENKKFHFWKC
jgi:hypothetical protein